MGNSDRKPGLIKRLWKWWRTPSRLALGTLLLIGFVGGIVFWGGFNTGMEKANTEEFCISCHEMRNTVYQEYMDSVHYNNRSGRPCDLSGLSRSARVCAKDDTQAQSK
ncbi:cytochrome C-type protein [Escherichia coli]|uniref:Cytochrome C-type protein n=1 Tax=Escherichia coli TaxID=562 RepID=A0A376W7T3_ECOLX|nr:cytochrome C-type protein [Escherichia coli]